MSVCMYVFFLISLRPIMLITPVFLVGTNYSSHKELTLPHIKTIYYPFSC